MTVALRGIQFGYHALDDGPKLRGFRANISSRRKGPAFHGIRADLVYSPLTEFLEFTLRDRTKNYTFLTNHRIVSTSVLTPIYSSLGAFLSETQTTAPISTDLRFTTTRPATFLLSPTDGIKTVFLWVRDFDNVVSGFSKNIDLNTSRQYLIKEGSTPPAVTDPGFTSTLPTTFSIASLGDGSKSVRVWVKDFAGNITSATKSITLKSFINATISLDLFDRSSGSAIRTNEEIISTTVQKSGPDSPTLQLLLSESATTPSEFDPGFSLTVPTTFDLSSGDGLKTVYLYAKDIAGNIISTSETITLLTSDTSVDVDLKLMLRDRFTGSYFVTRNQIVSSFIQESSFGETGSLQYMLSETQNTPPAVLDPNFATSAPVTFALSNGVGTKNVFLWVKDDAENIAGTDARILLTDAPVCYPISSSDTLSFQSPLTHFHVTKGQSVADDAGRGCSIWLASDVSTTSQFSVFGKIDSAATLLSTIVQTIACIGSVNADIAADNLNDRWILAHIATSNPSTSSLNVFYRRLDRDLAPVDLLDVSIAASDINNPEIAIDVDAAGRFVVAYRKTNGDVCIQRRTSSGAIDISETVISAAAGGRALNIIAHRPSNRITLGYLAGTSAKITRLSSSASLLSTVTLGTANDGQSLSLVSTVGDDGCFAAWQTSSIPTADSTRYIKIDGTGSPVYSEQTLLHDELTNRASASIAGSFDDIDPYILLRSYSDQNSFLALLDPQEPPAILGEQTITHSGSFNGIGLAGLNSDRFSFLSTNAANTSITNIELEIDPVRNPITIVDRFDNNSSFTYHRCVSVQFGCNTSADVFLSDTQTTPPSTTHPGFTVFSLSTTFCFPRTEGVHTIYAWYRENGSVNQTQLYDTITLTTIDPVLFLRDRVDNSPIITKEHVVSTFFNVEGQVIPVEEWLLSETQTTKPAINNPAFTSTLPTTFGLQDLSSPFAPELSLRTVYAWVKDSFEVLHDSPAIDSIVLGQEPSGTLTLRDTQSGSAVFANSPIVSTLISAASNVRDGIITGYLLSETQSTQPSYTDTRFVATAPQTFAFGATPGIHTVHLWLKTRYGVSENVASDSITFGAANPFTYIIRTGNNIISPAVKLDPFPMRVAHFLPLDGDLILFFDENNNAQSMIGFSFNGLVPGQPEWEDDITNPQMEGGLGYVMVPSGLNIGEIRTVNFMGTAISD